MEFLENEFETEVAGDIPLLLRQNLWIQLDSCLMHNAVPVRQWINDHYPQRWIDRGGPISWPPRSPDIMPMVMKTKVYEAQINTRKYLVTEN